MKKVWIIILGIFDIIVGAVGSIIYSLAYVNHLDEIGNIAYILPLPIFASWLMAFLCGIFTLQRKSLRWGAGGISAIVLAVLFYVCIGVIIGSP